MDETITRTASPSVAVTTPLVSAGCPSTGSPQTEDASRPDPWPDVQDPQPAPAYMDFVRTGVVPSEVIDDVDHADAAGADIVSVTGISDGIPATAPGNSMLARLGVPPIDDQATTTTGIAKRRLSVFAVIALMLGILCSVSFGFMGLMASYLLGIGHKGTVSLFALSTIASTTSSLIIRPSGIGALIAGVAGILECAIPHPRTKQRAHGWWLGLIGMVISVMPMLALALLNSFALI